MSIESVPYESEPTEPLFKMVLLDNDFDFKQQYLKEDGFVDASLLLDTVIKLDSDHSLLRKRFSQTPLNPSAVFEVGGLPYMNLVGTELSGRVYRKVDETGLPEFYGDAIMKEVEIELHKRIHSNDKAAGRLRANLDEQKISLEDAILIWRAKTGEASMQETGKLLLKYPVMSSVEALKYTEPLDWDKIVQSDREIWPHLGAFIKEAPEQYKIKYLRSTNESDPRRIISKNEFESEQDRAYTSVIFGWKENIAEVTDGNNTIQLVLKTTAIKMDPTLQLNIPTKIYRGEDGKSVALLPIAKMWYWRIKPQDQ